MVAPLSPSTREVLRRLELTVTRRLDGLLQGDHRGLVPAHGSELGEAREYLPGDDVRRIDWNVTARTRAVHVRETIADRELELWVLVDGSASLDFGTATCTKRDLAVQAAAAVGFLTAKGGNRIGGVLLQPGSPPEVVPARSGRAHLQALLAKVMTARSVDGTGAADLAAGLHHLAAVTRRRAMCVVISDWMDPAELWTTPLRRLTARHEVLAVEVVDPRELELPDVGVLHLVDPETGRVREVQTADRGLRTRFAEAAAAQRDAIAAALRGAAADHMVLRSDRDWVFDLVRFATLRKEHAARAGGRRPGAVPPVPL